MYISKMFFFIYSVSQFIKSSSINLWEGPINS